MKTNKRENRNALSFSSSPLQLWPVDGEAMLPPPPPLPFPPPPPPRSPSPSSCSSSTPSPPSTTHPRDPLSLSHLSSSSSSSPPTLAGRLSGSGSGSSGMPLWLHFFREFPQVALKLEANQRFARASGYNKMVVADCPSSSLFSDSFAPRFVGSFGRKHAFTAEWQHRPATPRRLQSSDSAGAASPVPVPPSSGISSSSSTAMQAASPEPCVALRAANGMYWSVHQKDGSLSLV